MRKGEIIREEKFQAQTLLNMCDKWNLSQSVRVPTREDSILDLIFVNSLDLVRDIKIVINSKLSDHNLIISTVSISDDKVEDTVKKNYCDTKIPEHNIEEASEETWEEALDWLSDKDLDDMTEKELVKLLNKLVVENFPNRNKPKVTK